MKRRSLATRGFTLIELMIAIAMVSLLAGAMYSVYSIQQRSYTVQEQVTEMQQQIRSALDFMTSDMRMAGYDPNMSCTPEITAADDKKIIFNICDPIPTSNNGLGIYRITYQFDDANKTFDVLRDVGGNNTVVGANGLVSGAEAIVDGVEAVEFQYFNAAGIAVQPPNPPLATPVTDPTTIRAVRISMLVRTRYPDMHYIDRASYSPASNGPWPNGAVYPRNDHYHRYLLITTIRLRNMGLQ